MVIFKEKSVENSTDGIKEPQDQQAPLGVLNQSGSPKRPAMPVFLRVGFIVIGFVAAAVVYAYLSKASVSDKGQQRKPAAVKGSESAISKFVPMEVIPMPQASLVAEVQDVVVEEKPIPSLALSGILFGAEGSIALINGRIVREGGDVEGARLIKISEDRVELVFQGQKIILRSK